MHELAGITECDPDVRWSLSTRSREEQEITLADVGRLHFLAGSKLFGDRARQINVILSEDEAHKPAAVES